LKGRSLKRKPNKKPLTRPSSIKKPGRKSSLSPKGWNGKLKNIPCFIIGNAPSLLKVDLSLLNNYFTIGINRVFYPPANYDPTILIWQDLALWSKEKKKVLQTKAIKYCRETSETQGGFYTFSLKGRESKLSNSTSTLYGRGSSGAIAYQFAHALGCNPIILVGMDCRNGKDKNGKEISDFYGNNPMHRGHTLPACVKGLKFIKDNCNGKKIINCSKNKVFKERYSIEEAVGMLDDKKYSREELTKILLEK
jgi:hypothetical protein